MSACASCWDLSPDTFPAPDLDAWVSTTMSHPTNVYVQASTSSSALQQTGSGVLSHSTMALPGSLVRPRTLQPVMSGEVLLSSLDISNHNEQVRTQARATG